MDPELSRESEAGNAASPASLGRDERFRAPTRPRKLDFFNIVLAHDHAIEKKSRTQRHGCGKNPP